MKIIQLILLCLFFAFPSHAQQYIPKLHVTSELKLDSESASKALYLNGSNQVKSSANVDSTELNYLDGVTSAIQTQIDAKQATITGGATSIVSSDLTVSRALVSDGSGKVAVSSATGTELSYISGLTSSAQTQINTKAADNAVVHLSGVETVTGNKTFSGDLISSGEFKINGLIDGKTSTNSTSTGSNVTLPLPTTSIVRLSNAGLVSVDMIASPVDGREYTWINSTGTTITFNNDTGGTAANRILTGSKSPIQVADEQSLIFKYDGTEQRWMVIGGTGSGGGKSLDTIFQLTGEDFSQWSSGNNAAFLGGGTLSGVFASETASPMHGFASYKYTQGAASLNDYIVSPAQAVDSRYRGVNTTLSFPYKYNGALNDIEVVLYDATNNAVIPTSGFLDLTVTTGPPILKMNAFIPSTCASIRVGFMVRVLNNGKILSFDDIQQTSDNSIYASLDSTYDTMTAAGNAGQALTASVTDIPFIATSNINGTWNGTTYTVKRSGTINIAGSIRATGSIASMSVRLYRNGTLAKTLSTDAGSSLASPFNYVGPVLAGETYTFRSGQSLTLSNSVDDHFLNIVITASDSSVLTSPDTFSTDSALLTWAGTGSYSISTLVNAPVGTFITGAGAATTNAATQVNSAPTQTVSDMNLNGIRVFTKSRAGASTAAAPSYVAIQIGKGWRGCTVTAYKDTTKNYVVSTDFSFISNIAEYGSSVPVAYNPSTGIVIIELSKSQSGSNNTHELLGNDGSVNTDAYFKIEASKNPSQTGVNTNRIYFEGAGNAGQAITLNVTDIPFISVTDTHSAWNGSQYTIPENGVYAITGHVLFTGTSVQRTIDLYVGGTISRQASDVVTSTNHHVSYTKYFTKNQVISLRAGTGTGTLSNLSTYHNLTITRVGL